MPLFWRNAALVIQVLVAAVRATASRAHTSTRSQPELAYHECSSLRPAPAVSARLAALRSSDRPASPSAPSGVYVRWTSQSRFARCAQGSPGDAHRGMAHGTAQSAQAAVVRRADRHHRA
jgi:hypothetical protein